MKATFARMQKIRNMRGSPATMEQPKVPVPVPTGPRDKQSFAWVSSRDPEIYPMLLCVAVGVGIAAFSGVRHLMSDPDVNVSRDRRETPAWDRYKPEEGDSFSRNHHSFANLKPNPINQFPESATLQKGTDKLGSKQD
ncbi:unnamed protein product [Peronospora farinosa]|uniref:Uncharacterized protein n=1 Tax=Peronospora farinosa TaxID=134698 RepID=A0AAV0STM5_9STRA|nr:unnamed protein product [Peronospora farinosa]CAI5708139.1 unnamed protein product [Peronospora farinosa]